MGGGRAIEGLLAGAVTRDGEGGRAVGVREQLLPRLAVGRALHELDGARHVPPVLEHQLERLAVEAHTPQHKDLRGIRVQPGVMAAVAYVMQPGVIRVHGAAAWAHAVAARAA